MARSRIRWQVAFLVIAAAALAVVPLAAYRASAAGDHRSAPRETAPECFTKLRQLVTALAKLEHAAEDTQAGKIYLLREKGVYYPVEKTAWEAFTNAYLLVHTATYDPQGSVEVAAKVSAKNLKRLRTEIQVGHELVQSREKRCNDLKQGGGSAGAGSTPTGGSFELIPGSTQVSNVDKNNLTIDASGTAHVEQGAVSWDETWTVPETITPGKESSVTLGLDVVNNGSTPSAGQYTVGIGVTASGGLTEQLLLDISANLKGKQTYEWTVPDSATDTELVLVIHPYESSSVTYHYRRSG